MATEFDKIFSGSKPNQLWQKAKRFGHYLCLHHQGKGVPCFPFPTGHTTRWIFVCGLSANADETCFTNRLTALFADNTGNAYEPKAFLFYFPDDDSLLYIYIRLQFRNFV